MSFGGILLAMTAVQAINSIGKGYAEKAEANYNATIFEGQANVVQAQKEIEYGQYQRQKGQVLAKSMARVGGAGIGLGGSAMAVMLDAQTQIGIDQAIGQFNLEQEKQFRLNQASQARRGGKAAVSAGYSNAFSSILTGASNYAMYKGSFDKQNTQKPSIDTGNDSKYYFTG